MALGGDVREILFSNPNVGSGQFFPKANEDSTIDTGGLRVSDDNDMIGANGEPIFQMNYKRGNIECTCFDSEERFDYERYVRLCEDVSNTTFTITWVNGRTLKVVGRPVGDANYNGNNTTFTFKVAGGKIERL